MQGAGTDTSWYQQIAATLRAEGDGEPHLVIDLDRLDANARTLRSLVAPGVNIRLVQKSLPSLALLRHLAAQLEVRSLMVFHRPFLNYYVEHAPEFDLLVGKPMPIAAAHTFYDRVRASEFDLERRLQWLIDTDRRLAQYQELAHARSLRLSISLEIDVGLHRGGLTAPEQVGPLLERIAADPDHLRLSGFMGYDAHTAKAPPWVGRERAVGDANARYRAVLEYVRERYPALWSDDLCRNGAGSPSLALHRTDSPLNDIAVGSALVKPTDFDLPTLKDIQPAALISAPVIKVQPGVRIPYLEMLTDWTSRLQRSRGQSVFLYGGHWMAQPVWPEGLCENSLYGLSSNHQMMNLPADVAIEPDDVTLWRPKQSEAVLLQFGALWCVRGGHVVDRWPVDPN